ncbi:hypothetical protein DH2020_014737 [Rehmannia glutinosa]|uniref:Protein kinase domain-containing protein n=1 Tax=Rehmannia glutinosa TaxID=99300 RepID=A0ABR0WXB0_REHGL
MFTSFHFNLLHSNSLSNNPFPRFLGVPPPGAHHHVRAPPYSPTTMAKKRTILSIRFSPIFLIFVALFHFVIVASSESEAEILIKFKESLKNNGALSNWDSSKPPCNGWHGIKCERGLVWGLKLENMGLSGVIDVETLAKLQELRTISFMHNNFDGSLPNFARLGALKSIYLSYNKFSGEISPGTFDGMFSLKKLHLANNAFSGRIPTTLATLPKLVELMLENNEFEGEIPQFHQDRLRELNVSNNELVGQIPQTLSHLNASSFSVAAALAALLAVIIILRRRRQKRSQQPSSTAASGQPKNTAAGSDLDRMERGQVAAVNGSLSPDMSKQGVRLTFLREGGERFDMPDLLKASAEVLGSGAFGSTYKAALNSGKVMVVKRFRQMNSVSREEFNEHMRRLGRLNHQNVLPILAFYYRKEEKLLVAEYVENVSLAVQLHGNKSRGLPSPDWPTRLNIVKGVAKGLQYLYNELPSLTAPHGHLKSSNVLLDASFKPLLADYGLVPVVNQEHAQQNMISYKSPEYKTNRRITKKTDVWSLGILILEILTGKFPSTLLHQGGEAGAGDVDLATWVENVVRDDSGGVVFDKDMAGTSHAQGEMVKLLKLGLSFCQADVDRRRTLRRPWRRSTRLRKRISTMISTVRYLSETDMRSSRGLSDDFKTINII